MLYESEINLYVPGSGLECY